MLPPQSDKGHRLTFKVEAKKKMFTVGPTEWKRIAELSEQLIFGRECRWSAPFSLDDMVCGVFLKITLFALFGTDSLNIDNTAIMDTASATNDLWVESKTSTSPSASNKRKLQKSLALIFQDVGTGLHKNPLNFILPAYETLWRVVLSCLMDVNFRPGASPAWREELKCILAEPMRSNLEQLDPNSSATAVLVAFIVKEALRLYPSTKTVCRRFHMETKED